MKIVVCAHDYPNYVSGPNTWMKRLFPHIQRSGIETTILFTRGGEGREYQTISELRDKGIRCYVYDGLNYTEKIIHWILQKLNNIKPDVFIPNLDIPSFYAARWVKESGIPTVGIIHSDDQLYRTIINEFVHKSGPFQVSAIVCVSKVLENLVLSNGNYDGIVRRIPYGAPIPDTIAQQTDDDLVLVYTGRLIEQQKRISDVTNAFCRVVKEIPGTKAVLYGSGPDQKNVESIISGGKVGDKVYLGGRIDNNKIQNKLSEGHIFVLLSDYEGLPISLMEAMACGLVPVCLNIRSGIPELVKDGETGLLVSDRGDGFVNAINRIKNEDGLYEKLSKNAQQKIINEYSIDASIKEWTALFSALKERAAGKKSYWRYPKNIKLPPVNAGVRGADKRWPGLRKYYTMQAKRFFKRYI